MFGHGAWSSAPFNALPDTISATFDLGTKDSAQSIVQTVSFVERALIERLNKFPDDFRLVDRRKFEEIVAELFSGFGYEVELTQQTRDGGKDIIAIRRRVVPVRFLIECKRPDPGNPITVRAVRELYGVKCDDGANKAILATTSYFSPDAQLFSDRHRWELELRDFEGLQDWIAEYRRIKQGYQNS